MDYPECSGNPDSCPENEGHGCCGGRAMTACQHGTPHRWSCETCDAPAAPEAVAWADNRAAAGRIGSVESTAVKANWEKTGHFRPAAERLTHPLITLESAETYAAAREAAARMEERETLIAAAKERADYESRAAALHVGKWHEAHEHHLKRYAAMIDLIDAIRAG